MELTDCFLLLAVTTFWYEAIGTRPHLDLMNSPFAIYHLADLAKICI